MTAPAPSRPITAEEFLYMPESDGAELLDGRIVEKSTGNESAWLGGRIFGLIMFYIEGKGLGRIFGPEAGLRVWRDHPNRVRKPDVMFFRSRRRPPVGWEEQIVPDLVVEVVSPNDKADDLEEKLAQFREAGIPLIWVIYPGTRSAHILTQSARIEVRSSGVLDGGDILPGFSLSLAELFAGLDEE